jgi:peptide/nickel transport system substrate-binding protein
MTLSRRAFLLTSALAATGAAGTAEPDAITCPLANPPAALIPGISTAFETLLLGRKIYRGLLRADADGAMQPDLATDYSISDDGLSYTFHLQTNVTWHDSGAFGAADVLFSLTRFHPALQPALHLDRLHAAAPDPATVVVTLPAPDPHFPRLLDALSLPIVPQHVHDIPGLGIDPRLTTPVGTGPFRYAGWLRLVRFEWYAGPKPSLAAIDCPILPKPEARTALAQTTPAALLAGPAVDYAGIPLLRGTAGLVIEPEYPRSMRLVAELRLNTDAAPLDSVMVRQGLACAIDREAVLREVWAGLGRVASGPWPTGSADRDGAASLPEYSPRSAADHFNKAGLRPDDEGVRARLTWLVPQEPPWPALASWLKRALGQVGIELASEPVGPDAAARIASGQYQVAGFTAGADLASYGVTDLLVDPKAAQGKLVAEMPAIWLVEPGVPIVKDRRLTLPGGVLGTWADATLSATIDR